MYHWFLSFSGKLEVHHTRMSIKSRVLCATGSTTSRHTEHAFTGLWDRIAGHNALFTSRTQPIRSHMYPPAGISKIHAGPSAFPSPLPHAFLVIRTWQWYQVPYH